MLFVAVAVKASMFPAMATLYTISTQADMFLSCAIGIWGIHTIPKIAGAGEQAKRGVRLKGSYFLLGVMYKLIVYGYEISRPPVESQMVRNKVHTRHNGEVPDADGSMMTEMEAALIPPVTKKNITAPVVDALPKKTPPVFDHNDL